MGANSSVASDAGYVILPPLAAALYLAAGRHPVAGLAAAFCGVAGGFGSGLFPTGGDGVLTGFAQEAAHVIDPSYSVTILHNFYFKVVSAVVVTAVGWWVTDRVVEPRLVRLRPEEAQAGGDGELADMTLAPPQRRALTWSLATMAAVLAREPLSVIAGAAPGRLVEAPGPRWSQVIVPMILLSFLLPGMVYGRMTGTLRTQADFVAALNHGIRSIVPVLVILFFLAQFVNYFAYSQMDRMLAYVGGSLLFDAALPIPLLIVLAVLQRYRPAAGLGTLISLMVPYSLALGVAWTALLVVWYFTGLPLGPTAPLNFAPGG